jgi:hypothetical protein
MDEFDVAIDESVCKLTRNVPSESVADRRTGQTRQQSALEKAVKVQHQIETTISQPAHDARQQPNKGQSIGGLKELDELATRKHECLVDDTRGVHDTGRPGFDQPGEVSTGIEGPKPNDCGQRSNHVSERTQSNDQDPIGVGWSCRSIARGRHGFTTPFG